MKIARIHITPELLQDVLHLPATTRIESAGWHNRSRCIELVVTDDGLKDVELQEHELPPIVTPTFQNNLPVEFAGWNQK